MTDENIKGLLTHKFALKPQFELVEQKGKCTFVAQRTAKYAINDKKYIYAKHDPESESLWACKRACLLLEGCQAIQYTPKSAGTSERCERFDGSDELQGDG